MGVSTSVMARQVLLAPAGVRIRQWPVFASASGQRDRPVLAERRADQDTSWLVGYFSLGAGSLTSTWSS
jgi:hypothetical protein